MNATAPSAGGCVDCGQPFDRGNAFEPGNAASAKRCPQCRELYRPERKRREGERARTISIRRLSKSELDRGREMYPETDYWRPVTRGDCHEMERPCPFVACKYHLYLDVHPERGAIKVNFPDRELEDLADTCSLDAADRGGLTLDGVAARMNLTRERARQLEERAINRLPDDALVALQRCR